MSSASNITNYFTSSKTSKENKKSKSQSPTNKINGLKAITKKKEPEPEPEPKPQPEEAAYTQVTQSSLPSYELSHEQQLAFDAYVEGKNIFITGPGGTGKSYLVSRIVKHAQDELKSISVTAMTGCAAVLLGNGATTIHSWGSLGLLKGDIIDIVNRISSSKYRRRNWKNTDILIVDEVSMMSKHMMKTLDIIGKQVRKNSKPFGGIQLIFSGDFFQLPPVAQRSEPYYEDRKAFCFESEIWNETFDTQIELKTLYRQKDEKWKSILNNIRKGIITKEMNQTLRKCVDREVEEFDVQPIQLYPTKKTVDAINKAEMTSLVGTEKMYEYEFLFHEFDKSTGEKNARPPERIAKIEEENMLKNALFDKQLKLKVGAQVMCIANVNMEEGICNGTSGIVIDMMEQHVIVKLSDGRRWVFKEHAWPSENIRGFEIRQIPLVLAWAVTIHKSQGATLERAEIDVGSRVFACGQTYVALSRVKSLDGLYLKGFDYNKIKVNEKVVEFYEEIDNN